MVGLKGNSLYPLQPLAVVWQEYRQAAEVVEADLPLQSQASEEGVEVVEVGDQAFLLQLWINVKTSETAECLPCFVQSSGWRNWERCNSYVMKQPMLE